MHRRPRKEIEVANNKCTSRHAESRIKTAQIFMSTIEKLSRDTKMTIEAVTKSRKNAGTLLAPEVYNSNSSKMVSHRTNARRPHPIHFPCNKKYP